MGDAGRLEHQLARRRSVLHPDLHLSQAFAPLAALDAQLLERAHPSLVARAARFDSPANPNFLLSELLVEQGGVLGLDLERRALLQHVVVVVAGPGAQDSPIEFDDPRRQTAHERAVVADEQSAPLKSCIMSSSHVIASISRWLVGSSSSKRSGAATNARPSITRRRQPPDSALIGAVSSSCSRAIT